MEEGPRDERLYPAPLSRLLMADYSDPRVYERMREDAEAKVAKREKAREKLIAALDADGPTTEDIVTALEDFILYWQSFTAR